MVTAGPTHEYIDPVRFISNKSSGKQGYEIAKSLKKNGFETTLVSGPTSLAPIPGVNLINVNSAEEMFNANFRKSSCGCGYFFSCGCRLQSKKSRKR